ncbi:MAG: ABC transporter ATP-binding protein [Candidatus Bipolaricaulota bacterium]
MKSNNEYLRVRKLAHHFGEDGDRLPVLRKIELSVKRGRFVSLIGPSGCGKSTFFDLLAGLISPTSGHILLEGREITGQRGHIAYMPQRDLLFPWRTMLENVVLGAEVEGRSITEAKRRARELLPLFGLEGFENARPGELSGGMRQRAALLRTVLIGKDLMALDEPFGSLDALTRGRMQEWLIDVWRELQPTILFVTHDIEEALLLSDRVHVMSVRPGTIIDEVEVSKSRPRSRADPELVELKNQLVENLMQREGDLSTV